MQEPATPRDRHAALVFAGVCGCFLFSGFAALLYQTAWLRQFSLVFGTSELAVAAVLSAYMGGLALGSAVAARYVHRVTRPILFYGLLELGIAVSALAVPWLLSLANLAYVAAFGGQPEPVSANGGGQTVFYMAAAFVVLAIPTVFMGATLPLLTRYAVTSDRQIGPRVGSLYSINTLGAVAGTVVAGFLLLPRIGLKGTIYVGVLANFVVFLIAALIARNMNAQPDGQGGVKAAPSSILANAAGRRVILPLMLLSGANAFVYEVLWTRLLGHILGGSVAAFATMLASFLSGITIGSAIAARIATTRERSILGLIVVQCAIALASMAVYRFLPLAIPETSGLVANTPMAVLLLLPATLFIGASFPFAVRIIANDKDDAAPSAARVYTWNTVGAIVGATAAAFFLIPLLKYEGALKFAVIVNLGLAMAACTLVAKRRPAWLGVTGAAAVVLLVAYHPAVPEAILRTSPIVPQLTGDLRFYEVGRSATVIVTEEDGFLNLSSNGLPEASTNLKGAPPYKHNQRLLAALPVLARPDARNMLIVGLGAGAALEGVPKSVESIDVVELEPRVVDANRSISGDRQVDPLADPRVNLIINDARSALSLTVKKYDAIVSQPSHPWTAGASHLYTREFMSLARDHLSDDGVYLQWMSTSFVDEALLKSLCVTMLDVFDNVRVYQWDPEILFFLGSAAPLDIERRMAESGRPLSDDPVHYLEKGIGSVEDVVVALAMDHRNLVSFAEGARVITDDVNLMATESARAIDERTTLTLPELAPLLAPYDPLLQSGSWLHADFPAPLNFTYISRRLDRLGLKQRAVSLSTTLTQLRNPEALTIIGLGQEREGAMSEAQRTLLRAIDADPDANEARFALLRSWLPRISSDPASLPDRIQQELKLLGGSGVAVVHGWVAAAQGDYGKLAQLDRLLAEVKPTDLWYLEAVKLRADWRIKVTSPDYQPALAQEATRQIDTAIALFQEPDLYGLRLAASFVADDVSKVIETARRLVHIFDVEVGRAEAGYIRPQRQDILGKQQQVEALRGMLAQLRQDQRVPTYKVSNLDAATERVLVRLQQLANE